MTAWHHEEFERRARIYRNLDARLAGQTRFFAAAALTNSVLAELSAHRARWMWISQTTLGTLLTLGGMLEALNLRRADSLDVRRCSCGNLDDSFVEMEQAYVESVLCDWARRCAARHHQLIVESDRVLFAVARGLLPSRCSPNVRRYEHVLRSVTRAVGRCPSFAICADRIRIGKALIQEARRRHPT